MSDEKQLFNPEQKLRNISKKESEVTLASHFLENLFVKSAPFEASFGKDISEFTLSEIMEFYKFIDAYSLESLALMNSNYSMYTTWALAETLVTDGQNHFLEVGNDIMTECLNSSLFENTIISREEFERCADTLPNYTDRFALYAIFEGIGGKQFEEITKMRLSDINENEVHLCSGRTMTVPTKFVEIAQMAAEEEVYKSYNSERKHTYRKGEQDLLFKTLNNRIQNDGNDTKNRSQVLGRRYGISFSFAYCSAYDPSGTVSVRSLHI